MRPRNREVNIFNMSLLDILCGALGAFCFMMLVLFPFWHPGGPNEQQIQQNAEEMQKELQQLKQQLQNTPGGAAAAQQISRLQQQLQQQQGQLNQMQEQLDQAKKQLEEAKKENQQLSLRNPFTIGMEWHSVQDIDLYTQWQVHPPPGKKGPEPVDPFKKQWQFYSDEGHTEVTRGPGTEIWTFRTVPPGLELKVYYKYFAANGQNTPVEVSGYYLWNGNFYRLPHVVIPHEKMAVYVGSMQAQPDYSVKFTPAPALAAAYQQMLEADKKNQSAPGQ
jgi:hypothetical protein